ALVNHNFDVVQIRGKVDRYLRLPQGEPSANLLKMAPEELFLELRSALNEARKTQQPVRRAGVQLSDDHDTRSVAVDIVPLKPPNHHDCWLLVMFQEMGQEQAAKPGGPKHEQGSWLGRLFGPAPVQEKAPRPAPERDDSENARNRQELAAMREYTQSLI